MKLRYLPFIILLTLSSFGQVVTFNVTMKPRDFLSMYKTDATEKYKFPASIEIPGMGSDNIKIRFKGSTTILYPKRPFKIKFNNKFSFYNSQGSVRNIKLNPMFTDKSYLREKIIWDMFQDMGGLGPRECGYANLYINGENRGVYILIQDLDEEFLDINNLDGNLYKSHEESSSASGLSLRALSVLKKFFKKEAGDEKDYSDLLTLTEKINNTPESDFANVMHDVFDMKSVYDWLVLNTVTQMGDTYNKNYYLFHDKSKSSQSWKVIPWDYDMSIGRDAMDGVPYPEDHLNDGFAYSYDPLSGPKNVLKDRIIANSVLYNEYKERLRYVIENNFNEDKLFPKVDEAYNLIAPLVYNDPTKWGTYNEFLNQKDAVKYFITARRNFLLNSFLNNSGAENDEATVNPTSTNIPYNFVDGQGKLVATMWFSQLGGLQSIRVKAFPSQDPPGISGPHIRRYVQITPYPRSANFKAQLRWGYYGVFDGSKERAPDIQDENWLSSLNYAGVWQQLSGDINPFGNYITISDIDASNCGEGRYFALAVSTPGSTEWNKEKNIFWFRFRDVKFSDSRNGFICGDDGAFMTTGDGGSTWKYKYCGIHLAMNKMEVLNSNTIIMAGDYGSVYKTVNSGASWQSVYSNVPSPNLNAINFSSSQNGYIAGNNGILLISNNGGSAWQQRSISGAGNLYCITNSGEDVLFTAGEGGKIFKSENKGSSWKAVNSSPGKTINALAVKSDSQVWAAGNEGTVLVSNDKGESWQSVSINTESDMLSISISGNTIYIAGRNGMVFKSENGTDWSVDNTAGANDLEAITFTGNTGFAVGNSGTILTTK